MDFFTSLLTGLLGSGAGGLTDVGAGLIAFFETITDGALWRSLGWLLLGILTMAAGLSLWARAEGLAGIRSLAGA